MIRLVLDEIISAMDGWCDVPAPAMSIGGVSTDSRSIRPGDLYFALRGPRFDGHEFVAHAFLAGASAAVVERPRISEITGKLREVGRESSPLVGVDDVLSALGRLAAFHRRQSSARVIAVVGSNGKTTTKSMIDHVLSARLKGRASVKSFNNAVGVPLTLLSAERGDEYLVVEIGTNAPGEIALLGGWTRPDMAVITSITEEHLQGLGDLDGVAAEEGSILRTVVDNGFTAVHHAARLLLRDEISASRTMVSFGIEPEADVRVSDVDSNGCVTRFVINGRFIYRLGLLGSHNAVNAAAAITIARRLGFEHDEIAVRLASFAPQPMRGEITRLGPVTLLNDAYNANPASMSAAFDTLAAYPAAGRRIAVIGEMRELGDATRRLHERVGRDLARRDFELVVLVGSADSMKSAFDERVHSRTRVELAADAEAAGRILAAELREGDTVLLKASRGVELERALPAVRERFESLFAA